MNKLRVSIHPPLRTQRPPQRRAPLCCAQVGIPGFYQDLLRLCPSRRHRCFRCRAVSPSVVWMKAGVLGSSAKLTGRLGRSEGPGGHVVQVAATHGAQGHAGISSGAGVERRHLCCSSAAAVLQTDTSLSICTDPFQPSLFALQQAVVTAFTLPGAQPGASRAVQQSQTQLPTSASASRHQPLVWPPESLPALLQIPNPKSPLSTAVQH